MCLVRDTQLTKLKKATPEKKPGAAAGGAGARGGVGPGV